MRFSMFVDCIKGEGDPSISQFANQLDGGRQEIGTAEKVPFFSIPGFEMKLSGQLDGDDYSLWDKLR